MRDFQFMIKPEPIDSEKLDLWIKENHLSRLDLAESLGIKRSVIDNWFARRKVPRNIQPLLQRLMNEGAANSSSSVLSSQVSISLNNKVLNMVAREALAEGMSIEEWLSETIEAAVNSKKERVD